jgi:hypothetical protein
MSVERVTINESRAAQTIELSLEARESRTLLFSEDIKLPEADFIRLLVEHSQEIGDERFALNALFLTTTMVFGSDTRRFFNGITNPDRLRQYSWIFTPEEVLIRKEDEVEFACREYLKPAGYSSNALKQWIYNCRVMVGKYGGDIRNFFQENGNDAQRIIDSLVVFPRAKTERKIAKGAFLRFGPKLSRLFVQWVNQYQLYDLKRAEEVGLPVDFQIARILVQTGAVQLLDGRIQTHTLTHKAILPLLTEMCQEHGWNPRLVSETLWLIGSHCCNERNHEQCSVCELCDRLISRIPYDKEGFIDATDIGK